MNRRIILSPDARADLISSARWYHSKQVDLPLRFASEVKEALLRIARFPHAFPCVRGERATRRAAMRRFRYYIDFIVTREEVFVERIIHQRRSDTVWQERERGDDD